jgi:hypothetical protein
MKTNHKPKDVDVRVKDFRVHHCKRHEVTDFIEKWHYSKSINGVMTTHCFGLLHGNELIGAMLYGRLGMANTWKKYVDSEHKILELRRLCCIDDTPKNTESYFIGHTLKWLSKNTEVERIVSYADMDHNHTGTIYKASNFDYLGTTAKGRRIVHGDRMYHDKAIRTYYKGKLKPFSQRLKTALEEGEAHYIESQGKHIYLYDIRRK